MHKSVLDYSIHKRLPNPTHSMTIVQTCISLSHTLYYIDILYSEVISNNLCFLYGSNYSIYRAPAFNFTPVHFLTPK